MGPLNVSHGRSLGPVNVVEASKFHVSSLASTIGRKGVVESTW